MTERKISKLNLVEFINTFSIWVLLGAFSSFSFFSKLFLNDVDYSIAILFSIGCWWVYTLDHILDGLKVGGASTSLRHAIHYAYRNPLLIFLVSLALVLVILVFYLLPSNIILVGLGVAFLTALHFFINHWYTALGQKLFFKEGMIALVVTIGFCLLPAFIHRLAHFSINWKLDVVSFFLFTLANVLLFTLYDFNQDKTNQFLSSAHVFGYSRVKAFVAIALTLAVLVNGLNFFMFSQRVADFVVHLLMQATLIGLYFFPRYFAEKERFRFWGDFIYVIPGAVLPFL